MSYTFLSQIFLYPVVLENLLSYPLSEIMKLSSQLVNKHTGKLYCPILAQYRGLDVGQYRPSQLFKRWIALSIG